MEREQRREYRLRIVEGMRCGLPWQQATSEAGMTTCRATAYNLLRLVRCHGEEALEDGRHGHPYKLTAPVQEWLLEYCRGAPGTPSRVVRTEIEQRFGVVVSTSQINRVRAVLGVGSRSRGVGGKSGTCAG